MGRGPHQEEHVDIWLGFGRGQVEHFFAAAGLDARLGAFHADSVTLAAA